MEKTLAKKIRAQNESIYTVTAKNFKTSYEYVYMIASGRRSCIRGKGKEIKEFLEQQLKINKMEKHEIETTEKGLEITEDGEYYYLTSDIDGNEVMFPKSDYTLQEAIIERTCDPIHEGSSCFFKEIDNSSIAYYEKNDYGFEEYIFRKKNRDEDIYVCDEYEEGKYVAESDGIAFFKLKNK